MIIGIGCDIVEHSNFEKLGWVNDDNTLRRIFSKNEIAISPRVNIERYYSSRFAAKEAILKCLGTGMEDGLSLKNIEITKSHTGLPCVLLSGQVEKISISKRITNWHISISHTTSSSTVFVIAESIS
ncbi:holo-ACP synthase [Salegentibacter mishustinae]|jgi:holo-[acyl-carrier protein] synthase|uniref:holo-ACP synthase n=1 Tax=Salegentibacter mishustinae TaxID=270918 RepID=UPI001CE129EB|nr:holo-ACP synthase [Salegentibacter mishustinae]UBZ08623.1 holo-ACP synthase [Salegentibacter mishustinae]